MNELLESIKDALTILRLTREVAMSEEMQERCIHFAEAFLDENLPRKAKR